MSERQPVKVGDTITFPESSFLVSLATPTLEHTTSTMHLLYHRPVPGKEEEQAEAVLARELHRMSCWSRLKFGLDPMPGHLGAVRAIQDVLAVLYT